MTPLTAQTYQRDQCVVFHRAREAWGAFSNMAGGFPLAVNGATWRTSEALFQACKFPDAPEVQRMILAEASPIAVKMRIKAHAGRIRPDWFAINGAIMRWCVALKCARHAAVFAPLLAETGDRAIVEESRRDDFWGAIPAPDGLTLTGRNALGRLWEETRAAWRADPARAAVVAPPAVPGLLLLGDAIRP